MIKELLHAKIKNPLNAAEDNVVRQRFSVLRIGRNGATIVPGRKADSIEK
jgi:hypothetical protein